MTLQQARSLRVNADASCDPADYRLAADAFLQLGMVHAAARCMSKARHYAMTREKNSRREHAAISPVVGI
jgi:hypothetical protein